MSYFTNLPFSLTGTFFWKSTVSLHLYHHAYCLLRKAMAVWELIHWVSLIHSLICCCHLTLCGLSVTRLWVHSLTPFQSVPSSHHNTSSFSQPMTLVTTTMPLQSTIIGLLHSYPCQVSIIADSTSMTSPPLCRCYHWWQNHRCRSANQSLLSSQINCNGPILSLSLSTPTPTHPHTHESETLGLSYNKSEIAILRWIKN